MECFFFIDSYIKYVHRITIHNKLHKLAIPLQPEARSFVPNRTFCVYISTINAICIPAEEYPAS